MLDEYTAGHRKLILTVWDRAEYWLSKSGGIRALGIDPDKLTQRRGVYDPKRLEEITRVCALPLPPPLLRPTPGR